MPGPKRQPATGKLAEALLLMRERGLTTAQAAMEAGVSQSTLKSHLVRHPEAREGLDLRRGRRVDDSSRTGQAVLALLGGQAVSQADAGAGAGISQASVSKGLKRRLSVES